MKCTVIIKLNYPLIKKSWEDVSPHITTHFTAFAVQEVSLSLMISDHKPHNAQTQHKAMRKTYRHW